MGIHGIAIREKKTKKLDEFMECDVGREALKILGGVRINLNHEDYYAEETMVEQSEIDAIQRD